MLELYILDDAFQPIGLVDQFTSFIWTRKYYDTGSFSLYCDAGYYSLFQSGSYLYRSDDMELGVLESLNFSQSDTGEKSVNVKGRFLKGILADRVIDKVQNLSGKTGDIMIRLVNLLAISSSDPARKIPHLSCAPELGYGSNIEVQATGDILLDKLHSLGKEDELSCRISYLHNNHSLLFEVWQGLDRTQGQSDNSWAVFSDQYENIQSLSYVTDHSSSKNFAYIAGAGEGEDRTVVTLDQTNGQPRRELYVDARDLQRKKDDDTEMTEEEYTAVLLQRGKEKLEEYPLVETFDAKVNVYSNLEYKTDYDLGDKCTFLNQDLGIEAETRITEITETYENGGVTISLVFGEGQMTIMQRIKREVTR